jgi:hypothetical protein
MDYHVVAAKISERDGAAQDVQRVLSAHGCLIKVRLGLHDLPAGACSSAGLLILEVEGEPREIEALVAELSAIPQVKASHIVL